MSLFGAEKYRPDAGRRHAMNLSAVSGGDVQIAILGERQRPDVLGLGIVEHVGLAGRVYAIHFPVRRCGRVHPILPVDRDRLHRDSVQLRQQFPLAPSVDREQLGPRSAQAAAAGVEDSLGIARHGPQNSGRRIVHFPQPRSHRQPAIARKRQVLERALDRNPPSSPVPRFSCRRRVGARTHTQARRQDEPSRMRIVIYRTVIGSEKLPVTI